LISIHAAALAGGLVFAAAPALAADTILAQSTFDSDLDGWTSTVNGTVSWSAGGGHPGGRMLFSNDTSDSTFVVAPAKFRTGAIDFKKLNNKGYIVFQHELVQNGGTGFVAYEIDMTGPGGAAVFTGGLPLNKLNNWQTVVAPLVQGNWTVSGGSWTALLNDVEDIRIRIELIDGSPDVEAIDNVKIVSHPKGFVPR